jgi:hypothetical protein
MDNVTNEIHDEDLAADRDFELMARPRHWPPLARRAGTLWAIDLVRIDSFRDTPPHRRVLLLLLLLALKDRATELHFEPWRSEEAGSVEIGLKIFYEVDGRLYELVPPPAFLASPLFRDLKDVAGLNSPRRRAADLLRRLAGWIDGQAPPPRLGRFGLNHSSGNSDVEVIVYDSELGERYFLKLPSTPETVSEAAGEEMRRLFATLRDEQRTEPPPPSQFIDHDAQRCDS